MGRHVTCAISVFFLAATAISAHAESPSADEIVSQCYYKNQGKDQHTRLAIALKSGDGKESASEYVRYWKDASGDSDLEEKMVLFTLSPKESRGVNYMRWAYRSTSGKPPEQWVYLPELQTVRRVSQRDPNDMTWGLTDEDFRIRTIEEDEHRLVETRTTPEGTIYVVEFAPKTQSVYSRWVTEFIKSDGWSTCSRKLDKFYDKNDRILKKVSYSWIVLDNTWVWDTVTIENQRDLSVVTYKTLDARVNVGLEDEDFTERRLKRGAP